MKTLSLLFFCSVAMWLTPSFAVINAAERYYETGVWHQGDAAAAATEPSDLRLALREVVCEECRMGHGLSQQLWTDITCSVDDDDDDDGVWLRVAAADKGEGASSQKQSQLSDDGTAEWRFRLGQLDVQGVLQRCVAMAAGVSGSLAEVRTAKALLLLVDDMAFDTIADPMARDADMVAPLPLQVHPQFTLKILKALTRVAGDGRNVCGQCLQRQRSHAV